MPIPTATTKLVNYFFLRKSVCSLVQNLDIPTVVANLQAQGFNDPSAIEDISKYGIRGPAIVAEIDPCKDLPFPSSKLERYAYFTSEIERRLEVIGDIRTNMPFKRNYAKIDAEIVASQIRRILELFATSFLMITGQKKKKASPHKAVGTLLGLKELTISSKGLIKEEFGELYGKCDKISHSENPFTPHRRQQGILFSFEFNKWLNKIHTLLECHAVYCSDSEICLRWSDNTGKRFVALIEMDSSDLITDVQVIVTESKEDRDEYFKGSRSDIDSWLQEVERNLQSKRNTGKSQSGST